MKMCCNTEETKNRVTVKATKAQMDELALVNWSVSQQEVSRSYTRPALGLRRKVELKIARQQACVASRFLETRPWLRALTLDCAWSLDSG